MSNFNLRVRKKYRGAIFTLTRLTLAKSGLSGVAGSALLPKLAPVGEMLFSLPNSKGRCRYAPASVSIRGTSLRCTKYQP